ncbi:hypothetical protein O0L34_g6133 [Tuta absoluta]|nr:hypothetical protein O0L34_g6133 [Tuta absoluta]
MLRAPTTATLNTAATPPAKPKLRELTLSAEPSTKTHILANNMANHSSDNLDKIDELTDLDRCRISNMENNANQTEFERQCSSTIEDADRCRLHKKGDLYGNESIIRKRVEVDVYGGVRRAANLKFKCVRDAQEWMEAVGRTMGVRVRAVAVLTLFLAMLATSCAAPAPHRTRTTRNTHHDKSVVSLFT